MWNSCPFFFSRDNHCGIFPVHAFIILLYTSDFINLCGLLIDVCVLKYTACIFSQHYVFGFSHFLSCHSTVFILELQLACSAASDSFLLALSCLSKLFIPPILIPQCHILQWFLLVALFQRLANDLLHIIFWLVASPSPKPCLWSEAGEWGTLIGLSPSQLTPAFGVGDKFNSNYMAKNGIGEVF